MATLMVYRGDAFDREVELGEGTVRLGRSSDNDIVLEDPTFTVSRAHAELRFEQGGYSLVDKNSENGVWVAGKRVVSSTLVPGVPAVLGCYKLVLKAAQVASIHPGERTVLFRPPPEIADATILLSKPIAPAPPVAAKPVPVAVAKPTGPVPPSPPAATDEPKKAGPSVAPPAPAATPASPRPSAQSGSAAPSPPKAQETPERAVSATVKGNARGNGLRKGLLFGGMAVVVIAGIAAVMFRMPSKSRLVPATVTKPVPPPTTSPKTVDLPIAAAVPPAVTPTTASEVTSPSIAQTASPTATPPPAPESPSPLSAAPLPGRRDAAPPPLRQKIAPSPQQITPAQAKPPQEKAPPVKQRTAPASTAVAAVPAKPKPADLARMFEAARSAMIKEDYLGAIAGFEAVLAIAPDYPNAANLLGVAHGGATNASHLAVEDAGNKAEMSGDYAEAGRQYERALQLDPSSREAADAMRRLKVRMQREGQDAVKRGQASDAAGRTTEAVASYEKALRLLPADDPAAKTAGDRLAVLKANN